MADMKNALAINSTVGNYRIERVLGCGNFGITYLAKHGLLNSRVAIKEYFPKDFCNRGPGSTVHPNAKGGEYYSEGGEEAETYFEWGLKRFIDEGRTLAKINHPNVVTVVDFLHANQTAYLCMQYEDGGTLEALLKQQVEWSDRRLRIMTEQVLAGLEAVHRHRIIHRDLKPSNLYWRRRDRQFMLIDFGAARQVLDNTQPMTHMFTHGYAPLEQYGESSKDYGPWTDLYALGAVLYRCLTGRAPMPAPMRVYEDQVVPAAGLGKGRYSLSLLTTIDRALALNWRDRYSSAAAMRAALSEETIAVKQAVHGGVTATSELFKPAGAAPAAASAAMTAPAAGQPALSEPVPRSKRPLPLVVDIHGWSSQRVRNLQQRTARALGLNSIELQDEIKEGGLGPALVVIPAGTFLMGSPTGEEGRDEDEVQRAITLSRPFAMSCFAITFEEYDHYCELSGARQPSDYGWGRGRRPVVDVSWEEAQSYTRWLSRQTGVKYRLPTEAEWEYACRAGATTAYWWGDHINTSLACYNNSVSAGATVSVEQFLPNPWGLHQTHGNTWEWVADLYNRYQVSGMTQFGINMSGIGQGQIDPLTTRGGPERVMRGGAWCYDASTLRAAARSCYAPERRSDAIGFRVVRELC